MNELVYKNETMLRVIALVLSILIWLTLVIATFGIVIVYILIFALIGLIGHSALIAHLRGNAVPITARQFPDLYERLRMCSGKLGMMRVPEAYLANGNGIMNAFATHFLGRKFVVLLSDVVDSMESRPGALDFYIGHEIGHLQRNHVTWSRLLAPALFLPVLGPAYARACEYTCDRHGLHACENPEDAQYGLVALAAGKHRWRNVNLEEYAFGASVRPGFWMSLHELIGDYPWLHKRVAWVRAVADNRKPRIGRRNPFSWFFSLFVPHVPGAGAAGGIAMVAMIAILAAIAIPQYQSYLNRVAVLDGVNDSAPYRAAVTRYGIQNRRWPSTMQDVGLAPFPGDRQIASIELGNNGSLIVSFRNPPLNDKQLELTPYVQDHQIHWSCGGSVPAKILPATCSNL